ncbi:hypothetical protein [Streptomyces sp. KL118A]|uniref:hypothetical protein n=1 Tax=Streptomyces sp. KL118A TaxID=3045153 RepID=UPI00278C3EC4|nr:hypothetical protein [Streptomyces sp. KL118A]
MTSGSIRTQRLGACASSGSFGPEGADSAVPAVRRPSRTAVVVRRKAPGRPSGADVGRRGA